MSDYRIAVVTVVSLNPETDCLVTSKLATSVHYEQCSHARLPAFDAVLITWMYGIAV